MEGLYSLLLLGVIGFILFGERIFGMRCPVCGSKLHWETRSWGSNKDYEEDFCMNCCKAMYDPKSGKIITFETTQDWK